MYSERVVLSQRVGKEHGTRPGRSGDVAHGVGGAASRERAGGRGRGPTASLTGGGGDGNRWRVLGHAAVWREGEAARTAGFLADDDSRIGHYAATEPREILLEKKAHHEVGARGRGTYIVAKHRNLSLRPVHESRL